MYELMIKAVNPQDKEKYPFVNEKVNFEALIQRINQFDTLKFVADVSKLTFYCGYIESKAFDIFIKEVK